jgi:hypothetical protein
VLDLSRALGAYQYARYIRGSNRKRRFSVQAPQPECVAVKESLALSRLSRFYRRPHQTGCAIYKINASKRLIDFEFSRPTRLRIDMTPVVEAKCRVAVLLNLEHHNVSTQRVDRPGWNEDPIAGFRRDRYEMIC